MEKQKRISEEDLIMGIAVAVILLICFVSLALIIFEYQTNYFTKYKYCKEVQKICPSAVCELFGKRDYAYACINFELKDSGVS